MNKLEREYVESLKQELDNIEQTMLDEINSADDCSVEQIKLNANTQIVLALQRATERGVNKATIDNLSCQYEW